MTDEELIKLLREWSDGMSGGKQVVELIQAADRIEALTAELKTVLDREAESYFRHLAKVGELTNENERLRHFIAYTADCCEDDHIVAKAFEALEKQP